jgi:hypothetical protein
MLLLLVAACASAQDFRATVTGLVTDPSGAAVPGATVRATNIANNAAKEVQSSAAGIYTIPYLDPGVYRIEVTMTGFQTLKRENITLEVSAKLNLPLQLTVGQVTESITVVGQQEILETADANRGLVFDPIKTQQYPLNGRQIYMLLMLTPGVIFTQESFGATGFSGTRAWDNTGQYRFAAARAGGNLFLLNGMDITSGTGVGGGTTGVNSWALSPNVEAVQEFKVMTNTYDATFGIFRGGVINTTTKSGTNKWHGDVFEYWRNSIFDANYFQNKANPNIDAATGKATPKPYGLHNQHQFGGVVGGPVRKDKDFVFFSYEGWQEVIPYPINVSTPPMALRDGQHFTAYGAKIYDPLTMRYCGKGDVCSGSAVNNITRTYIRDPFQNNAIPAARISPIGQKILSYWPEANSPGVTLSTQSPYPGATPQAWGLANNYLDPSNKGRYYYEQPMGRWDHVFSEKDKLFVFYNYQEGYEYRTYAYADRRIMQGNAGMQRFDTNYSVDWTRVISPTSVLDMQLSYGRLFEQQPGYADMSLTYMDMGIKTLPVAPTYASYKVVPHISMSGANAIFGGGNTWRESPIDYWTFNPSFVATRGKHTLKFGFTFRRYVEASATSGATSGSLSFASSDTQQYNGNALNSYDGSGVASILLGVINSGSIPYQDSTYPSRPTYSAYVQDDWKLTPKLTLNLGLRYDVQVGWKERYGRSTNQWDWSYKDPNTDAILAKWAANKAAWDAANPNDPFKYPAVPTNCCYGKFVYVKPGERVGQTDWTNIGPRLGAAYRLRNKTVVRGGIGLFFENAAQSFGSTSMFSTTTNINTTAEDGFRNRSAVAGISGPYSLENPYPLGSRVPPQRTWTGIGGNVSFYNAKWHGPRTWQYSFTIQQELPHSILLEAAYNGNYNNHIATSYNSNMPYEGWAYRLKSMWYPSGTYSYTGRNLTNPFYGILDPLVGYGTNTTISSSSLLVPNPAYGSVSESSMQVLHYRGDSFTLKLEQKAFTSQSGGALTWVFSYSFSKGFSQGGRPFGDYYVQVPANLTSDPAYKTGMGAGVNSSNTGLADYVWAMDSSLKPHNLSFSGVYDLPFGKGKKWANTNTLAKNVFGDWRFDWIFTYVAGNGINYFSTFNYCGKWYADKQDENHWFNNDPACYGNAPTGNIGGYLFEPQPGYGVIPNYAGTSFLTKLREPQAPQVNIAFEKTITISERYKMTIRGESFNFTNTPIRNSVISSTYTNANFGILNKSQRNFPRFAQVAAKFYF